MKSNVREVFRRAVGTLLLWVLLALSILHLHISPALASSIEDAPMSVSANPDSLLQQAYSLYYNEYFAESIPLFHQTEAIACNREGYRAICLEAQLFRIRSEFRGSSKTPDEWRQNEYGLWQTRVEDAFLESGNGITQEERQWLLLLGAIQEVNVLNSSNQGIGAEQLEEILATVHALKKEEPFSMRSSFVEQQIRMIALDTQDKYEELVFVAEEALHENIYPEGLIGGIQEVYFRSNMTQSLMIALRYLGRYHDALEWALRDVDVLRSSGFNVAALLTTSLGNTGSVYYMMGNYALAVDYYLRALDITTNLGEDKRSSMAVTLRNIGACYVMLQEYGLAGEYLERAQILLTDLGQGETYTMSTTYSAIAELYKLAGDFESSERAYVRAMEIRKTLYGNEHPELIRLSINTANLYIALKKYPQANDMLEQARSIARNYFQEDNPIFLEIEYQQGRLDYDQGKFLEAVTTLTEALNKAGISISSGGDTDYSKVADPVMALNALISNNGFSAALYDTTGVASHLEAGLESADQAISLLEYVQSNPFGDDSAADLHHLYYNAYTSKLDLLTRLQSEYGWGAETAEGKEWFQEVFETMELARSRLASVLLNELESESSTELPSAIFTERRGLYQTQMELRQELLAAADSTDLVRELRRQLLQNQEQLNSLQRKIAEQYPDYYAQMINRTVPSLQEVQKALLPDEAMLIYMLSEKHIYALVVQEKSAELRQLAFTTPLRTNIRTYQGLMDRLDRLEPDEQTGLRIALEELYESLIAPVEDLIAGKDLLLSPDQELHYLPFDLLLTEPTELDDLGEWPFLVRHHSVSVIQSVNFWLMRSEERERPANEFLGMAPFSDIPSGNGLMGDSPKRAGDTTLRAGDEGGAEEATGAEGMAVAEVAAEEGSDAMESGEAEGTTEDAMAAGEADGATEDAMAAGEAEGATEDAMEATEEALAAAFSETTRSRQDRYVPLLMSAYETSEITKIVQSGKTGNTLANTLLGSNATETNFWDAKPGDYRFLHFSTHAEVVDSDPSLSNLLLYPSGGKNQRLYAGDIYGLKLSADLVVLSACETALGEYRRGDGLVGFTRAFFFAGAKNVIASMWKVNDRSTALFMIKLYESIAEGHSYRDSLRMAKLSMLESPQFDNPFYWAAFQLQEGFR